MKPPGSRLHLSLVFPAYDEAGNLETLIPNVLRTATQLSHDFEVIFVDDGSRDGSGGIIGEWCLSDTRVRCIQHASNLGYGAALRSGLREARGELVFFSDADLQFDLAEIGKLLAHTERFDVVAGYRSPRRDPWPRRAIAAAWGCLVRALFGLRVRDIDCAFKVFRRDVLDSIPIESIGAFINTEILVRARAAGYRIHQVPVSHRRRLHGRQTGAHPRVVLRALRELLMLHGELRLARRGRAS